MTDIVVIGEDRINLDPFQEVVAFDFPSGDFIEYFIGWRAKLDFGPPITPLDVLEPSVFVAMKGDQRSTFTDQDVGYIYDDNGIKFAQAGNQSGTSSVQYITDFGTTYPPSSRSPCWQQGEVSVPDGWTQISYETTPGTYDFSRASIETEQWSKVSILDSTESSVKGTFSGPYCGNDNSILNGKISFYRYYYKGSA